MSSLLLAMSTATEDVLDVIVARIRLACTPWPSCTSEEVFSRMKGMSRLTASSRMACVDGPKAARSPRMMKFSSSASKSNSGSCSTRSLTSRTASSPAARPTVSSAYA